MSAPRAYPRAERVREAIREIVAAEVEKLRDPGLGFVTITGVSLTPDLRHAKIYYTVYGEEVVRAATNDALGRATGHVRAAIAHQIRMRYTPEIEFVADPVPDHASRIDLLIAKLHERDE